MLDNLIRNAVEASSDGHKIAISLWEEEKAGIVRIHNDNSVLKDICDRFFEKYVSSGKSTGTGLGSYSAKLSAETQRGSIHLETSDEKGTTVTVRLPKT